MGRATNRLPRIAVAMLLAMCTLETREAPATVAEQRARLPPAAECASQIAGTWKALVYTPRTHIWYEFILDVREGAKDPTALSGRIFVDAWEGTPITSEPPVPCVHRYKGTMPGRGSFVNGQLSFGGGEFTLTEVVCGGFTGYNPDQFSGQLDPVLHEFQAVNNDGGEAVNDPSVFRRIGCFDDERKAPGSGVTSPPFFPKRSSSGC
jgi:hypothetical protein